MPDDIRLQELKVGVIVNTSSGSYDSESEQTLLRILSGAGVVEPKVWCGEAKEMERVFAEAAGQKLEVLIVLGGDGTIRTAAEACAEKGPYLIPLPGGTLNMLPRTLYGNVSWEETLKRTLTAPLTKVLSGGWVSNKRFFIAAIVGAPALWIKVRESVREGAMVDGIEKGKVAFKKMFETKVRYHISGEINGEAEAVVVICPLISEKMSSSEHALEAAVVDVENLTEVISVATAAAFGKWRDDRKIQLTKTRRLAVQSSEEIPATLDGESVNLGTRSEIAFIARALTVLVPGK